MKIGLITIHWANNYGASLQAFATVKALQQFGEVTLLDYRTEHAAKGMQLMRFGLGSRDILRASKDLCRIVQRYRVIKKFKDFTFAMPLSRKLRSADDFASLEQEFDCFVCGSDQIWNPSIAGADGQIDSRFLLDFAGKKTRVSYASSMGSHKFTTNQERHIKTFLNKFSAISVREKDTSEYLESLIEGPVTAVIDPTLLHSREDWLRFFKIQIPQKKSKERYILVYALHKDKALKDTINHYRKKLNIKVIAIDQDPFINFKADLHIKDASPIDFVRLFSQADLVVTNSFHGTCFSVIFNNNFVVTQPPSSPNRIKSLLEQIGLSDRLLSPKSCFVDTDIDYTHVNDRLEKIRSASENYLRSTFSSNKI